VGAKVTTDSMDALRELAAANPSVHELLRDLARAVVDAAEVPRHDRGFPGLSDNRIADEPDDASTKGKPMRRVHGPYRHYDRWRIKIVDRTTGKVANETFPTEQEARVAMAAFRRRNARESGIGFGEALGLYERYLAEKGNKPRSIETTIHRLRNLFGPVLKIAVVALTPTGAAKLYDGLTAKDGSPIAIDTRRNALNQGKTFLKWCKSKGHTRINALEDVQGVGKRRRGKPQLTIDEARRFLAKAIELAEGGDDGAVAAAMALLMGMRGSEIAERIVRNLDDGGRILWITDARRRWESDACRCRSSCSRGCFASPRISRPRGGFSEAMPTGIGCCGKSTASARRQASRSSQRMGCAGRTRRSPSLRARRATWWRRRSDTSRSPPPRATTPAPKRSTARPRITRYGNSKKVPARSRDPRMTPQAIAD
jgi:integrase